MIEVATLIASLECRAEHRLEKSAFCFYDYSSNFIDNGNRNLSNEGYKPYMSTSDKRKPISIQLNIKFDIIS